MMTTVLFVAKITEVGFIQSSPCEAVVQYEGALLPNNRQKEMKGLAT